MAATADRRFTVRHIPAGTVQGDPDRLTQALRNLLRNAVEHTDEGGRIEVAALEGQGRIVLAVDDDGSGIAPEERERVFDRFHRGAPERARRGGGTGLGLAIVKAVAEAHGGRAWAEASELGGARIAIELPGFAS
jgi:signal transduction histidine kinase